MRINEINLFMVNCKYRFFAFSGMDQFIERFEKDWVTGISYTVKIIIVYIYIERNFSLCEMV